MKNRHTHPRRRKGQGLMPHEVEEWFQRVNAIREARLKRKA